MKRPIVHRTRALTRNEVLRMNIVKSPKPDSSSFRQGLVLGFAAPMLFLGQLPRHEIIETDNVANAWSTVGKTLRAVMNREGQRVRDQSK